MDRRFGALLVISLVATICMAAATSMALQGDTIADAVLGQPGFSSSQADYWPGIEMQGYGRVAIDRSVTPNRVYVVHTAKNRVLGWSNADALVNGAAPDIVIGQSDFLGSKCNAGGLSASTLCSPGGVAVDGAGNLWVADTSNNRILEYDSPFTSDKIADRIFGGTPNCATTMSTFCLPQDVGFDPWGNLYVADTGNARVLEFDAPLADTTADRVLGQGAAFTCIGGISAGTLCRPSSVASDAMGNLYVADTAYNRVLEFDAPRTSDALADRVLGQGGDFTSSDSNHGGLSAESLSWPTGVAIDSSGDLFVADRDNQRVLRFPNMLSGDATADVVFGQGGSFESNSRNLNGVSALSLAEPGAVALDEAGRLYVDDVGNRRVVRYEPPFTTDPAASLVLGQLSLDTAGITGAGLAWPNDVAVDISSQPNRVYVSDAGNNRILGWSEASSFVNGAAADVVIGQPDFLHNKCNQGLGEPNAATLCNPAAVAVDSMGNLYVADLGNNRVLEFGSPFSGKASAIRVFGQQGNFNQSTCGHSASGLCYPAGVALDKFDHLYVADSYNNRVVRYGDPWEGLNPDLVIGQPDFFRTDCTAESTVCGPVSVAVDIGGNLYVAHAREVLEFNPPLSTGMAASQSLPGSCWGPLPCSPKRVAVDAERYLYVTWDSGNIVGRVAALDSGIHAGLSFGKIRHLEEWNLCFAPDADNLCGPEGVAVDGAGSVFIADSANDRVLKFDGPFLAPPLPTPTPTPASTAELSLSRNHLDFPKRVYGDTGDTSAPKKLILSNPDGKNGAPVIIDSLRTQGDFQIASSTCRRELAAGAKCDISVTFTPAGLDTRDGKLTIRSNAANNPNAVALAGHGVAAKMAISPMTVKFPKQAVWTTSAVKTVTLKNNNRVGLTIASITSSDPQFVPSTNCVGPLAPKSQCAVSMTFTPTAAGKYSAILTVVDNAAAHPAIKLTGTCK